MNSKVRAYRAAHGMRTEKVQPKKVLNYTAEETVVVLALLMQRRQMKAAAEAQRQADRDAQGY